MPAVTHNGFQPRGASRWTRAANFADAVLPLPTTVARRVAEGACGGVRRAPRSEGMAKIDGATGLRRVRVRRDDS
jgi:hypothetical protein